MIACRNATLAELDVILGWAADEGWNPGFEDAPAFFAADPTGFFVATDADDGLIAAISVVNHSPGFAFLGLYIVRPEHRGKGIGMALWTHALAHAGDRVVGLDGVEDQQDNYRVSGFVKAGGTTRFTGTLNGAAHPGIRPADPGDIPELIGLEAAYSGALKPAYLTSWFQKTQSRETLVEIRDGALNGFCTVRKCRKGSKIGPLIATDDTSALRLIEHVSALHGGPLTLDVPAPSAPLAALCGKLGMTPGFRTARMYKGTPAPVPETSGHFAVVSLELG